MISLFVIGMLSLSGVLLASRIHIQKQRNILLKDLTVEESYQDAFHASFGIDGAVAVSVTAFDLLYNTAKMNPDALAGMAHLHNAQNLNSFGDLLHFE